MARGSLSQLGRSRYSAGRREVRPQNLPSRADHALQHELEGSPGLESSSGQIMMMDRKTSEIHPLRKVAKQSVSVPVASPSRHRRWPEPRPDLDRNEDPTRRLLVARERANLVGLKLFGSEAGDPSVIESTTHLGCLLKPAGDGVPGNPFDPGNRGNADTLDSESDDPIESSSSMLETVVGRAFRRGERLSALAAPVSTAFPGPGSVESVANDVSGTDFAPQRTCEIETSAILSLRLGPDDERTVSSEFWFKL